MKEATIKKTKTYEPVPFKWLQDQVLKQLSIKGYEIIQRIDKFQKDKDINTSKIMACRWIIKSNDSDINKMFALLTSHNKKHAVVFASGVNVAICTNGLILGTIRLSRKHTGKNCKADIIANIKEAIKAIDKNYEIAQSDIAIMKANYGNPYELFGKLVAHDYFTTLKQMKSVSLELNIQDIMNSEDNEINMWDFYNIINASFKSIRGDKYIAHHAMLHNFIMDYIND